ncbi:hypothetical protein Srot_2234 [Segniliparus rotundus DSM 44985]|uniref:Uncharacterized protein n=1 Tax=Segniliparus rotundus (strain ATCC BAA-972 / CDC 1076 / CIP 108378 / DSM 44985 / JCM 13578) TaxID=640132 RepID=D6ZA15_SEGRD|nr:hypothetical protein [Segniliparus rotundus]ADG98685.1 hypothetical protein Srot_2234 [Segniliparus rotundus DSM 44985]
MLSPVVGSDSTPEQRSSLRHSAHWAALLTCAAGVLALCYGESVLDPGAPQLASTPLIAAGLFWLAELVLAAMSGALDRGLIAAPAVALLGFGLVCSDFPFRLAWHSSKGAFDSAAAELRQHPQEIPGFHGKLGMWEIDAVQAEPSSQALYFEVAGEEPDRPVFANVPGDKPADWGSYRDCADIAGDWQRCVWRF